MKYFIIILFSMALILFWSCATIKSTYYYSTVQDRKISGDTAIIDLKVGWGDYTKYFWPLKHVSDSMVLFSRNLFHPWVGLYGFTRCGWCPIDSVTSNMSKIINLGSDQHKIITKFGIIPDSGMDSINIYTYGCHKKFENTIIINKDSITISDDHKKEIMKRKFGIPYEHLLLGLFYISPLVVLYLLNKE